MSISMDVASYLSGKGHRTFKAAGSEVTAHCFLGCPEDAKGKGKLYINTESWLYSCLTADARMVTRQGTYEIGKLAGRTVDLLTHQGWRSAPIRSFGIQPVFEIVMVRDQQEKRIRASAEHRWIMKPIIDARRPIRRPVEKMTATLRVGDRLASVVAPRVLQSGDRRGIVHGIALGDGSARPDGVATHCTLWGEKRQLVAYFNPTSCTDVVGPNGVLGVRVNGGVCVDVPGPIKTPPSMACTDEYLLGWLQGYFATDGTLSHGEAASPCIDSAIRENLERVREIATRLGIPTSPIGSYWRKGITSTRTGRIHEGYLHRVTLHLSGLWPEFFIREDQRATFLSHGSGNPRLSWRVVSVTPAGEEEVYCAVVPGPETFALEDNLLTGNCKKCDAKGNRKTLLQHFGDDDHEQPTFLPGQNPAMRRRALSEAAEMSADMLLNNPKVLAYLTDRGLSVETIMAARLGFVPAGWSLTHELKQAGNEWADLRNAGIATAEGQNFFSHHITIPYLVHGDVVQLRGRAMGAGAKYVTPSGDGVRLYNADSLHGAKHAIIVEGEFDAMMVAQTLRSSLDPVLRATAVVGVAGSQSLPTSFASYFEECAKIYIGFDPDEAGRTGALRVKEMLGSKARILSLPDDLPACDWSDYLRPHHAVENPHGGHDWHDVQKMVYVADSAGRRLYTARDAYLQWQHVEDEIGGVELGFTELDKWIAPGLKPGQMCIPIARTGVGKGCPLTEAVSTPDGWRKWGALKVGDQVFGRSGGATVVTGVFDRGVLPTYRVGFSDHSSLLVDGDHIWCVRERGGHRSEWIESTRTTAQLLRSDLHAPVYANGRSRGWRYTIPMTEPIQHAHRHLPIEPYTLGALIANGGLTNGSAQISTPDRAVIERIRRHYDIPAWSPALAQAGGYCPHAVVKGLIGEIRCLGLDVKSGEKFIPSDYLLGSVEQRVALLQGLMDGDGSARDSGRASVTYSTTSFALARDIRELVTGLGGTANVRWYHRTGRPDESTVGIMLPDTIEPFSSPVKVRGSARKHTEPRRAIVSITRVADQEIRCISVAAPDQLYVVGRDHIVTHNTAFLVNIAYNVRKRPTLFISLEMTASEVYSRLRRVAQFWNPLATDDDITGILSQLRIVDQKMVEGDLTRFCEEFEEEVGTPPQVAMVDYLGYYANGTRGGSPYERVSKAVIGLKEEAKACRVALIVPHQAGRSAAGGTPVTITDARDSGGVEDTADILMSLYRPSDADTSGAAVDGTVRSEILKNRNGRINVTSSLNFSLASLVMVDKHSIEGRVVDQENNMIFRGEEYAAVRRFRIANAGKQRQLRLA
jgi:replicative DNA helicase